MDAAKSTQIKAETKKKEALGKLERAGYWGHHYPEYAHQLLELTEPFADWTREWESPATVADQLDELVTQAVFWKPKTPFVLLPHPSRKKREEESKWAINLSLTEVLNDEFRTPLEKLSVPRATVWPHVWEVLGVRLGLYFPRGSVRAAFCTSLLIPCTFLVNGKPEMAKKFGPLLQLWAARNYPEGFNNDKQLIVHVAS